jgi:hypothetical protein
LNKFSCFSPSHPPPHLPGLISSNLSTTNTTWRTLKHHPLGYPEIRKPKLTCGIEIEFVAATAPVSEVDPEPDLWGQIFEMHYTRHYTNEQLVGSHISKTIDRYEVPAELHNGKHSWKPTNSASWILKTDQSICVPEPGLQYEWAAIEINSPTFFFDDAVLRHVGRVCNILLHEYRINTNRSCAIHVHIGNASKGFSYQVVRNLMAML